MPDLTRWGNVNGFMPVNSSYPTKRTAKTVIEKGQLDGLDLAIDARLTEAAMDMVVDLDIHRQQVATNNETNQLCFQLEAGFAVRAGKKLNNRNSPFGF